jgi:hypothetical protein
MRTQAGDPAARTVDARYTGDGGSAGRSRIKLRLVAAAAVVGIAAFTLGGCSTQARAERKGKEAGNQICKAKDADNANEAERHMRKADDKLDDLARFTGFDVREAGSELDRNLRQIERGNASGQDINAVIRALEDARHSLSGNALAAYDGLLEGLANCE